MILFVIGAIFKEIIDYAFRGLETFLPRHFLKHVCLLSKQAADASFGCFQSQKLLAKKLREIKTQMNRWSKANELFTLQDPF